MVKRISDKQREKAWQMYDDSINISQIAKDLKISYFSAWSFTEGRKQGFKNLTEYYEHLAVQKGFKNLTEYYEHLAENRSRRKANKELSDLIKSRLKELGKSQSWLAEQIGVTGQAISYYVQAKIVPRDETLEKLFIALEDLVEED